MKTFKVFGSATASGPAAEVFMDSQEYESEGGLGGITPPTFSRTCPFPMSEDTMVPEKSPQELPFVTPPADGFELFKMVLAKKKNRSVSTLDPLKCTNLWDRCPSAEKQLWTDAASKHRARLEAEIKEGRARRALSDLVIKTETKSGPKTQ
ncbi:unnamed protein product [Caenorhabditis sp. 36 PRJEB53466]|nr:unnamed protein product [Caenorhabditis sp. 36 PRJEB53466]